MTIKAWRIVSQKHESDAISGNGARLYPGRWNLRNISMVYTSESLSLAALEMLVHFNGIKMIKPYICFPVEFDENEVLAIKPDSLSPGWDVYPAIPETQRLGTQWIQTNKTPVLKVPSAIIQTESNYLLNPNHPHFNRIKIGRPQEFRFDTRLHQGLSTP